MGAKENREFLNRTPPARVRRALRSEVGFACAVPGCGSPYLEWHHFDPPWKDRQHHEPGGMIALCGEHHAKAGAGAFTIPQLRAFKTEANRNRGEIIGRFDWLRRRLLAVAGGNFFYETPILFQVGDAPVIWFRRDRDGYLLLNLRMFTTFREPRLVMEDNFWIAKGAPTDLECPPSGRLIHTKYSNGDEIGIEFFELLTMGDFQRRYPTAEIEHWIRLDPSIEFPMTAVEVQSQIGGTDYGFLPGRTQLPGVQFINSFSSHCGRGIWFNDPTL